MKHLENYNTHSTFTCEDCLQEKSTFHESFQKNNTCEDCFNEQAICDRCNEEMSWCNTCQMFNRKEEIERIITNAECC